MNELLLQEEFVAAHPFDQIAALVLADRLQEDRNYSRFQALRAVARIRRDGRDDWYISHVARMFASDSPALSVLFDTLYAMCFEYTVDAYPVYLVRGYHWPAAMEGPGFGDEEGMWVKAISVGVRWIAVVVRKGVSLNQQWAKELAEFIQW